MKTKQLIVLTLLTIAALFVIAGGREPIEKPAALALAAGK